MEKTLKKLFVLLAVLCIPAGFFTTHDHVAFFWHKIPSFEVIFGFFGAFLLILTAGILAAFAQRKEDFYD